MTHDIYAVRHQLYVVWRVPKFFIYAVDTGVELFVAVAVVVMREIYAAERAFTFLTLPNCD